MEEVFEDLRCDQKEVKREYLCQSAGVVRKILAEGFILLNGFEKYKLKNREG